MPAPLPIALARERAGLSVPELASAIGINEAWCWDLLVHEEELSSTLSLRQFLNAASALHVSPLSLLPEPVASPTKSRSFDELAKLITNFCAERGITSEQFGELAGWDVRGLLNAPSTALDDWDLECLRDVCAALNLHWPDFLPDEHYQSVLREV
jgi:transcriptional regulator with XRE-family HTH domain